MATSRNNRNADNCFPAPILRMVTVESRRRLLNIGVVDDEPIIRELLQEQLWEQGHSVTCFETPQQALMALRQQQFDVILSDVMMPRMNGLEFYERVAELYPFQAERILFLSGDVMGATLRSFLERTGCAFLAKPFRQAALLTKIEEVMQCCERNETEEYLAALPKAA